MTDYLKAELDRLDDLIAAAKQSLSDPQLKLLAEAEITKLEAQKQVLVSSQNQLVKPPSPPETTGQAAPVNSVILEIRPGTGGEEAKIWANDLEEMYTRFANSQNLTVTKIDQGVIKIKAKNALSLFKNEAGVHRVQRVPQTEAQGRIHTSTATIAVLPEVKAADITINPKDLEIQFYHASSQGGQNVQKVSTAVRITHKPTGIVTTCQTQRFQDQNRKIALELLRSKLYQIREEKTAAQIGQARLSVGHAMRAEKIRTYNFPQNRVTDHRIKKSWKNLDRIMEGNLSPIIQSLG